jgi:VanZ family protein
MKTVVVWLAMVFVLSVYPFKTSASSMLPYGDRLLHFIIYAITTPLLYTVLAHRRASLVRKPLALAVLLSLGYGLAIELAQELFFSRAFSLQDVAANALGAAAGAVYVLYLRRSRK